MLVGVLANVGFAVFGAVVGLVLGAAFTDPLSASFQRGWTRLRARLPSRSRVSAPHGPFRLGPLVTPAYVYEGDGTAAFQPENVTVRVQPVPVAVPDEVARWREEIEAEQRAIADATGQPAFWNGLRYAVAGVSRSREYRHESPRVSFTFQFSDYYTFLAAQRLDEPLEDGSTLRQRYLDGHDPSEVPAFLGSSFGVNVAVVTRDRWLVFSLRSGDVGSGRALWNSSANEGVSREIDSSGRNEPDLFRVAERGLREELALEYGEYDLSLLGFAVDTDHHQWGALFTADLRSLSAAELRERHSRGISDRWEHRMLEYVPFNPTSVIAYLLDPYRVKRWAPCAPVLFYFALIYRFGRGAVENAVRAKRRGGRRRPHVLGRGRRAGAGEPNGDGALEASRVGPA